jgi:hypothetical protein
LKNEKEQELDTQKTKYEKIIDEMKKNLASDRDFLQKELQKRIEQLE